MNETLTYLRGRRMWLIRDFVVWGALSAYEFSFLLTAADQSVKRIAFMSAPLGGQLQKVNFADLQDFRGNNLPATIQNPKVVALAKSAVGVIVVGQEDSATFAIARTSVSDPNGLCDLLVIEVG